MERVKTEMEKDPRATSMDELIKDGKARHFWIEGGLILIRGWHVYVPSGRGLRHEVL